MIWNWLKSLFTPKEQKDPHEELYEVREFTLEQLGKMTKGDLKKLKEQGKIKSVAYPFY
jgi:hypothetical protein|tara:strand:+ start:1205 stop:1381 length:177 start_codon:yes stop_codon:yes gene_type:complete